jgi:hypothetical protein
MVLIEDGETGGKLLPIVRIPCVYPILPSNLNFHGGETNWSWKRGSFTCTNSL